ncbi:MAG: hypothetical protein ABI330_17830 [Caldimonas sp.]
MRITLLARIERADGAQGTVEIFGLERASDAAPSSGLGLVLGESRYLAAALQRVTLKSDSNH